MSDLLTTSEIAAIYRVSPFSVTRWAKSGLIPIAARAGKMVRFDAEQVAIALAGPKPIKKTRNIPTL